MFLKGIDYQYCKGCLKCVEACPTKAISPLREMVGFAKENRVHKHFLILKRWLNNGSKRKRNTG